jgi:hypothetical protein
MSSLLFDNLELKNKILFFKIYKLMYWFYEFYRSVLINLLFFY